MLLKALYPSVLSMEQVQRYLRAPKLVAVSGEYTEFWTTHLPKESTPEQLAQLLDSIAERLAEYRPFMVGDIGRDTRMGQLPVELLDRALRDTRLRDPSNSMVSARLSAVTHGHSWSLIGVAFKPSGKQNMAAKAPEPIVFVNACWRATEFFARA